MSVRTSVLLAATVFVAACGGQTGTADHGKPAAADSSKPTAAHQQQKQDNVFTPLTSTIDRAKAVQGIVDKQAAKQRQAIENQSK